MSEARTVMRHGKRRVVPGWRTTLDLHLSTEGKQLLRKAGKKGLHVALAGDDIMARSVDLRAP